jgi:hypothetical protein
MNTLLTPQPVAQSLTAGKRWLRTGNRPNTQYISGQIMTFKTGQGYGVIVSRSLNVAHTIPLYYLSLGAVMWFDSAHHRLRKKR